jgi:hypothetical protein
VGEFTFSIHCLISFFYLFCRYHQASKFGDFERGADRVELGGLDEARQRQRKPLGPNNSPYYVVLIFYIPYFFCYSVLALLWAGRFSQSA